jgi:long-chain fatty acid transport protein
MGQQHVCLGRLARLMTVSSLLLPQSWGDVSASGFEIREQGATAAGTATAGAAATGEDASTVFYNPAAMTLLDEDQAVFSGNLFILNNDYDNETTIDVAGGTINGNEKIQNGVIPVPSLFAVWSVTDEIRVGIGVTAPFGLATEYDEDWVGRYNTRLSSLNTIDFNPSVAMQVTDWLSLGAGVSVQYAKGERLNTLDFGGICFSASGLGPGGCTALGIVPQGADGELELTADDWGIGYNLGILLQPTSNFRIGIAYRSQIHHRLDGRANFTVPTIAEPLTAGGVLFQDTDASAKITLPERISLSLYYELSPRLSLLGDVTWTNWSRFEELRIEFSNPNQPAIVQPEDWRDTFRYSIGARYQVTEEWVARAGIAFDETPIHDSLRNPGIPGNDRLVFAVGAGYRLSDAMSIDFAYTYNREFEASMNVSRPDSGTIIGDYHNSVHILSAQAVWQF